MMPTPPPNPSPPPPNPSPPPPSPPPPALPLPPGLPVGDGVFLTEGRCATDLSEHECKQAAQRAGGVFEVFPAWVSNSTTYPGQACLVFGGAVYYFNRAAANVVQCGAGTLYCLCIMMPSPPPNPSPPPPDPSPPPPSLPPPSPSPPTSAHTHDFGGVVYFMPNGFPGAQHGGECPVHAQRLSPSAPPPVAPTLQAIGEAYHSCSEVAGATAVTSADSCNAYATEQGGTFFGTFPLANYLSGCSWNDGGNWFVFGGTSTTVQSGWGPICWST